MKTKTEQFQELMGEAFVLVLEHSQLDSSVDDKLLHDGYCNRVVGRIIEMSPPSIRRIIVNDIKLGQGRETLVSVLAIASLQEFINDGK